MRRGQGGRAHPRRCGHLRRPVGGEPERRAHLQGPPVGSDRPRPVQRDHLAAPRRRRGSSGRRGPGRHPAQPGSGRAPPWSPSTARTDRSPEGDQPRRSDGGTANPRRRSGRSGCPIRRRPSRAAEPSARCPRWGSTPAVDLAREGRAFRPSLFSPAQPHPGLPRFSPGAHGRIPNLRRTVLKPTLYPLSYVGSGRRTGRVLTPARPQPVTAQRGAAAWNPRPTPASDPARTGPVRWAQTWRTSPQVRDEATGPKGSKVARPRPPSREASSQNVCPAPRAHRLLRAHRASPRPGRDRPGRGRAVLMGLGIFASTGAAPGAGVSEQDRLVAKFSRLPATGAYSFVEPAGKRQGRVAVGDPRPPVARSRRPAISAVVVKAGDGSGRLDHPASTTGTFDKHRHPAGQRVDPHGQHRAVLRRCIGQPRNARRGLPAQSPMATPPGPRTVPPVPSPWAATSRSTATRWPAAPRGLQGRPDRLVSHRSGRPGSGRTGPLGRRPVGPERVAHRRRPDRCRPGRRAAPHRRQRHRLKVRTTCASSVPAVPRATPAPPQDRLRRRRAFRSWSELARGLAECRATVRLAGPYGPDSPWKGGGCRGPPERLARWC